MVARILFAIGLSRCRLVDRSYCCAENDGVALLYQTEIRQWLQWLDGVFENQLFHERKKRGTVVAVNANLAIIILFVSSCSAMIIGCGSDDAPTPPSQASSGGQSGTSGGMAGNSGNNMAGTAGTPSTGGQAGSGQGTSGSGGVGPGGASGSPGGQGGTAGASGSAGTGGASGTAGMSGMAGMAGNTPNIQELEMFTNKTSVAICGALFRCCSEKDREDYFTQYANHSQLMAFVSQLPPQGTVTEQNCPMLVQAMLDVVPFGRWVEQAKKGEVTYDAQAFTTCEMQMNQAACGKEVREALYDGTCLGFNPPAGGDEIRKIFKRTATNGQACEYLNDGQGAAFFGSCDPKQAFCCYPSSDPGKCGLPTIGAKGVCKTVSKENESCQIDAGIGGPPDLQLCETGLFCNTSNICQKDTESQLNLGDPCYDSSSFELLGTCPASSYCDLFGTSLCEPQKMDGATCQFFDECIHGACQNQMCATISFCE
jgi:hypothetical protein